MLILLKQGIIDPTRTETGQFFSCMLVMAIFYACRFMRYIERLVATHSNKRTRWHAKKPENIALLLKLTIDMAVQSQAVSVTHYQGNYIYYNA